VSSAQNVNYLVEPDQDLVKETVENPNGTKTTHEGAIYNTTRLTEICSDLRQSLEKDRRASTEHHCSLLENLVNLNDDNGVSSKSYLYRFEK